jgi:RNA polymerase sigma-70 factor (ECF subfamily)
MRFTLGRDGSSAEQRMSEQNDLDQFLQATARGDREAFARLYELTAPRLLAAGMHMLKRREVAEDVLQDLFVKVWHRASEYHAERGSVMTWLYSVQRYLALDRLRAQRPMQAIDEELSETLAFEGPDPAALAAGSEMAMRVHGCLQQLTDTQRRTVTLAFFEGLTHTELTQRLQQPLGTVKSWIRRGLMSLQRCLER